MIEQRQQAPDFELPDLYGRTYLGNERTTFIVDREGRVAEVLRKVKPAEHDERVLEALGEASPPLV